MIISFTHLCLCMWLLNGHNISTNIIHKVLLQLYCLLIITNSHLNKYIGFAKASCQACKKQYNKPCPIENPKQDNYWAPLSFQDVQACSNYGDLDKITKNERNGNMKNDHPLKIICPTTYMYQFSSIMINNSLAS